MAIIVEVESYCQDCPYFEADIKYPSEMVSVINGVENGRWFNTNDTIIKCEHRKHCANLARMIKGDKK